MAEAFLDPLTFSIAFVNFYFDYSDYIKPFKPFIDDSLFWEIESSRVKKANFYVMKTEA